MRPGIGSCGRGAGGSTRAGGSTGAVTALAGAWSGAGGAGGGVVSGARTSTGAATIGSSSGSSAGAGCGSGSTAIGAGVGSGVATAWATAPGSTGGAGGLAVFTSRGAGMTGAAGFAGSGALPPGFLTMPRATVGVSAYEAFEGTLIPRCLARRLTNSLATTSSIVLDALLTSMP